MSKEKGLPPVGTGNAPSPIYNPFVGVEKDERAVRYGRIEQDIKVLSGKLLTLIDASIPEPKQNKAFKDIVRNDIRLFLFNYQQICFYEKQGHSIPDEELEFN